MNILYSDISGVRAVLGLTEREVPTSSVSALDLETLVELELDIVYPSHVSVKLAVEDASATVEQQKIYKLLRLFCSYQGAVFLLPQLQMLVAQAISDGDAEVRRFSVNDLEVTKAQIRGRLQDVKEKLNPEISGNSGLVSPLLAVQPDYDPVTNEGA